MHTSRRPDQLLPSPRYCRNIYALGETDTNQEVMARMQRAITAPTAVPTVSNDRFSIVNSADMKFSGTRTPLLSGKPLLTHPRQKA